MSNRRATKCSAISRRELAEGLVVPVLIGSAEGDNGVRRLLKALRHEVPEVAKAAERAGINAGRRRGGAGAQDLPWRPWRQAEPGAGAARQPEGRPVLHGPGGRDARIGGIFALSGDKQIKSNAKPRPAIRWRWRGWTMSAPARRCPPTRRGGRRVPHRTADAGLSPGDRGRRTARTRSSSPRPSPN